MVEVSAVIPAYNASAWIARAIDSVLSQTVAPAEIIVVDDGSTDSTAQAVHRYGAAVRYFHQDNSGPAVARNRGIAEARSEWIAFLDADDEWLSHKLELQSHLLEREPELKWCCGAREMSDNGAVAPCSCSNDMTKELPHSKVLSYFSAVLDGIALNTPGFVIHKSVFGEIGGFDPEMPTGQDGDMWCRIGLEYPRIGYSWEPCWRYHHDNPNSVHRKGHGHRDLQLKSLCRSMRRAMELGPDTVGAFYPYARMKAMDYLVRAAGRDCSINRDTIEDARGLFRLTSRERTLLRVLRMLPRPLALRAVSRLSP